MTCIVSDLVKDVDVSEGKYDFILANIVADIVLRLIPDLPACATEDAKAIFSGIIEPRLEEVKAALTANGWVIDKIDTERDWCAVLAHRVP